MHPRASESAVVISRCRVVPVGWPLRPRAFESAVAVGVVVVLVVVVVVVAVDVVVVFVVLFAPMGR